MRLEILLTQVPQRYCFQKEVVKTAGACGLDVQPLPVDPYFLFNSLQKAHLKLPVCLSKLLLTSRKCCTTAFKQIVCFGPQLVSEYACSAPSIITGNCACTNCRQNRGPKEFYSGWVFFCKCKICLCCINLHQQFLQPRQSRQ